MEYPALRILLETLEANCCEIATQMLRFSNRGGRGSVSSSDLIVSSGCSTGKKVDDLSAVGKALRQVHRRP